MQSDVDLVKAFLGGDQEAFEEIYNRYDGEVREVISRYSGRLRSELDDVVQDFWSGLLKSLPTYNPTRPFRNWLFSCAIKTVSSYRRLNSKDVNLISPGTQQFQAETDTPASQVNLPDLMAMRKELGALAIRKLSQLPQLYRNALHAVFIDGDTVDEYAKATGLVYNTAYYHVERGLAMLRDLLSPAVA